MATLDYLGSFSLFYFLLNDLQVLSECKRLSRHRICTAFVCHTKSFVITCVVLFRLLVGSFGRTDKSCLCIFLLFLLYLRVTNIGLIIMIICRVLFKQCVLEINSNGGFWREHTEFCSSINNTYFHYHHAYGHQNWQNGDLP